MGDYFIHACGCVGVAVVLVMFTMTGLWPLVFAVPVLGLTAIMFCHLEHRARRRLDLPRSVGTIIVSVLAWILFLPITALIVITLVYFVLASTASTP